VDVSVAKRDVFAPKEFLEKTGIVAAERKAV
jgi:hypothetical protein